MRLGPRPHLSDPRGRGRVSSQGNDGTNLKGVALLLLAALVVAFVIGSAAGKKDGCEASGKKTSGMECVEEGK